MNEETGKTKICMHNPKKNNGECFEVPTVRSTVDMCFFIKMERKSKISSGILFIALD